MWDSSHQGLVSRVKVRRKWVIWAFPDGWERRSEGEGFLGYLWWWLIEYKPVKKGGKNRKASGDEEGRGSQWDRRSGTRESDQSLVGLAEGWKSGRSKRSGKKVGVWPWEWVSGVEWRRSHWKWGQITETLAMQQVFNQIYLTNIYWVSIYCVPGTHCSSLWGYSYEHGKDLELMVVTV